ncbi:MULTISPECIES: hypothetical protein [unclassified Granulicatella]|uniref:hypothetical protein n=1 Tax=unclassified Granulicatella TaxID=2630493 RepID=UPI001073269A|nr:MULTISPECIES: hypothetical protein [unclassified Granulicatella]MBF0779856.1 hypothetical protein [Granulicatella sp. 19428wC4_WM01]TFU96060.1 hypothetical protein E4T68_01990 [Granulicatella sp. WM01]
MTTVMEKFDALFAEKKVPVQKVMISDELVLYHVDFTLSPTHILRMEMIFQAYVDKTDIQLTYRYASFVKDYQRRAEVLELINQLNESHTGYYRLFLAGDGEVYLKTLMRVHDDILPAYESLIQGPPIVRGLLPDLEAINGPMNMEEFK